MTEQLLQVDSLVKNTKISQVCDSQVCETPSGSIITSRPTASTAPSNTWWATSSSTAACLSISSRARPHLLRNEAALHRWPRLRALVPPQISIERNEHKWLMNSSWAIIDSGRNEKKRRFHRYWCKINQMNQRNEPNEPTLIWLFFSNFAPAKQKNGSQWNEFQEKCLILQPLPNEKREAQ